MTVPKVHYRFYDFMTFNRIIVFIEGDLELRLHMAFGLEKQNSVEKKTFFHFENSFAQTMEAHNVPALANI